MKNIIYSMLILMAFVSCKKDEIPEPEIDYLHSDNFIINGAEYEGLAYSTRIDLLVWPDVFTASVYDFYFAEGNKAWTMVRYDGSYPIPDSIPFTISGVDTAYGYVKWTAQDPQTIEIVYSAKAEGDTVWNNYRITH